MEIHLHSTSQIIKMDGFDCRVWEGKTEGGAKIVAFIPRLAAERGQDLSELEAELKEEPPPQPEVLWPAQITTDPAKGRALMAEALVAVCDPELRNSPLYKAGDLENLYAWAPGSLDPIGSAKQISPDRYRELRALTIREILDVVFAGPMNLCSSGA